MSTSASSPSVCTWCTRWSRAMKVPVRPTPALGGGGEGEGEEEEEEEEKRIFNATHGSH